jgi:hypothetical protein
MQGRYEKSLRLPFLLLLAALGFPVGIRQRATLPWRPFAVPFADVVAP